MSASGSSGCGSSSSNNNKKPDKPNNEHIEEFNNDSDINILNDAESIIPRNRVEFARVGLGLAESTQNVAENERTTTYSEILPLYNDIETIIQDHHNGSSSSSLNSSNSVQNEPLSYERIEHSVERPNNTSNNPTSNNIVQSLSLATNSSTSELNVTSISNESTEIEIGTPSISNNPADNNIIEGTTSDDSVLFVDDHRQVIDLCTPQVRIRRRNIAFDNSVIIVDDPEVCTPGPPKRAKLDENMNASGSNNHFYLKCAICLEASSENCPASTPCGHIFCYKCIVLAFKNANYCPLCKRKFKMACGVSCVDKALNKSFFRLGSFIGKHPGYFIIIPFLVTLLCMTGYQQLKYEIDPEYLFSPIRGEGKTERAVVEHFFKVNYTHRFNVGRITRPGRFGRVIVVTKDGNENMLRREVFQDLRKLDDLIQNSTVHFEGETFTYKDACARWENECFSNDILNLDYIMDDIESGELNLTFPIMFNPVTWDAHAFPVYFGGTKLSEDNTIISVPAIQLVYFVTADTKRQDAKGAEWEETFLDVIGKAENSNYFKHISVAYFASRTLDHELEKNTQTVVPYFSSTFILMALFSVITCMMGDSVRSKPWLGLMGNVSAIMATLAAFGFAMYLGIEFIGINLAAPFLMIGIGIDDTFVMLAAWRRTSSKLCVSDRMAHTMSEAAVSITITSLTDMISFWIGIISPFPSVRIFCTYSGFAVCFTFLWHITFFAACMAISGYREEKNIHALLWIKVKSVSEAKKENRGIFYRTLLAGGINRADPDNPMDNKEHMLMAFFKNHVSKIINNKWSKALILLIFAGYLGGACYGITQIKEGLERRKLSREDSYSVEFFDREDDFYREFPYRIQVIVTGDLNYSDPITQMQIEELTQSLENTSYVNSPLYTESWIRSFVAYYERNNDYLNVTIDDEQSFIDALKEIWLFPANPFSLDVKFNENGTKIMASRFLIQAINITDTNHEKIMVRDLRQICKDSPLNASVFHPYFVFFDQFELVRPTSIQAMVIGAIIMMLISFIFIPNILCSLWVAFSVISIEVGVAGYMALWDVNLDSISMINLIMCIGFSVDFTAHICYTYMSSKKKTPEARVREALYSLGLPIIQGSMSTILGVIALLLAESYIFLVFFKMVFLVIFFGAMHGLFLLPVLLSLFGPGSCSPNSANLDDDDDQDIDNIKMPAIEKISKYTAHPYYISHPQLGLNAPFGNKTFLGNLYKAYGDEKDLGIGTSGEDSSESSSSKSQRRQAIEDENVRRRYEEGWRRSSFQNLNSLASPNTQFQSTDFYTDNIWSNTGGQTNKIYYEDDFAIQRKQLPPEEDILQTRYESNSPPERNRKRYRKNNEFQLRMDNYL